MKCRVVCLFLLGTLGPVTLPASDLSGLVAVGVIETDNVQRTAVGAMRDTIAEALADITLHEQTRRAEVDVLSDLQYLRYAHDVYPNELVGNFSGTGRYTFVPGHFEWVTQDNFGQQQLVPGEPITPLNLENINYFSTGPNVIITLGPVLHALIATRYSRLSYQTSNLGNNRADGSVDLVHPLTAISNVSLNVDVERVRYDDSIANPDFTTEQGYLHYDVQGARSKLSLDLGYDDVAVSGFSSKGGGALVRGDISRTVSASTRLEFSVGQNITDNGNLLRQLQSLNGVAVNAGSLLRANDPFVNRYARIAWKFDRNRTAFSVDVEHFQERHFDESDLDQLGTQANVRLRRSLTPQLAAEIGASYAKTTFRSITGSYRDVIASTALEWRFERHLDVRAEYDHFDHNGDLATNEYVENRIVLTIGFRLDHVS
jgi:hypothetical protein